jgi:hypothetical protein
MPIQIQCDCGKKLRVKDESAGKKIRCPGCQEILSVPAPELVEPDEEDTSAAVTSEPPKPASRSRRKNDSDDEESTAVTANAPKTSPWDKKDVNDEDEEERPRSRKRPDDEDDEDEEDRPRRRKKKRRRDKDGSPEGESSSQAGPYATIGGGVLMMVGATVWCIAGLAFDRIFIYPPILFVIGIVAVVRGAMTRE